MIDNICDEWILLNLTIVRRLGKPQKNTSKCMARKATQRQVGVQNPWKGTIPPHNPFLQTPYNLWYNLDNDDDDDDDVVVNIDDDTHRCFDVDVVKDDNNDDVRWRQRRRW